MKVVLITDGSNGIGKATAIEFAKLGYRIVITGDKQDELDKTLGLLKAAAADQRANPDDLFITLLVNQKDPAQAELIVRETVATFGRIDILINNTGYVCEKYSMADPKFPYHFQQTIQVNLMAVTRITQLSVPHLVKNRGVIVNVSAIDNRIPKSTISYSVSKAGLSMLTKTVANGLSDSGIRVVTVAANSLKTDILDSIDSDCVNLTQHSGESIKVANTILFLCSDEASFITGCTFDVGDGMYSDAI